MFDDLSHQIQLTIILISTLFACSTSSYWIHWSTVAGIALTTLIIDMMFFQEGTFIYDPDYNHWEDLCEEKDFQIKID